MSKNLFEEIQSRIQRDIAHYGGRLPERVALAWSGYLAALIEWNLISVSENDQLIGLLPPIDNDPAIAILLGRQDEF